MRGQTTIRVPAQQRGVALFLALVVLLIITILGVSALQTTTLGERMAANARDRDMAFQAAEAALLDAERYLQNATLNPFGNAGGLYLLNNASRPDWVADSTDAGSGFLTYSVDRPGAGDQAPALPGVTQQPRFFIERYPEVPQPDGSLEAGTALELLEFYRVTAIGFGARPETTVLLRTTFQR